MVSFIAFLVDNLSPTVLIFFRKNLPISRWRLSTKLMEKSIWQITLEMFVRKVNTKVGKQYYRSIARFLISVPAAGAADDFYKKKVGTRFVLLTELRDKEDNFDEKSQRYTYKSYAFTMPKRFVRPTCEENYAGFLKAVEFIKKKIGNSSKSGGGSGGYRSKRRHRRRRKHRKHH